MGAAVGHFLLVLFLPLHHHKFCLSSTHRPFLVYVQKGKTNSLDIDGPNQGRGGGVVVEGEFVFELAKQLSNLFCATKKRHSDMLTCGTLLD